jgi:hypothetical protein
VCASMCSDIQNNSCTTSRTLGESVLPCTLQGHLIPLLFVRIYPSPSLSPPPTPPPPHLSRLSACPSPVHTLIPMFVMQLSRGLYCSAVDQEFELAWTQPDLLDLLVESGDNRLLQIDSKCSTCNNLKVSSQLKMFS